jgi:hypothetical protein
VAPAVAVQERVSAEMVRFFFLNPVSLEKLILKPCSKMMQNIQIKHTNIYGMCVMCVACIYFIQRSELSRAENAKVGITTAAFSKIKAYFESPGLLKPTQSSTHAGLVSRVTVDKSCSSDRKFHN